jgi:hypothetical protein
MKKNKGARGVEEKGEMSMGLLQSDVVCAEMSREELVENENRIAQGLETFKEVGAALLAIRDRRGYRFEYATFEEYCLVRWGLKQSRAYQFIDAAKAIGNLKSSTIVELPANESQARPLTQLNDNPALQREAWQRAVENTHGDSLRG